LKIALQANPRPYQFLPLIQNRVLPEWPLNGLIKSFQNYSLESAVNAGDDHDAKIIGESSQGQFIL